MKTGMVGMAVAWLVLSVAAAGEPMAARSIVLPDLDKGGAVLLDIGTGDLVALPPAAAQARTGQVFCPAARQVGDIAYDDADSGWLIVSSMVMALVRKGTESGLARAAPSALATPTETGMLQGFTAGDLVLLQDRRGLYVLLLVVGEVTRGLQVAWVATAEPKQPFGQEHLDALHREAQRIEQERKDMEERQKPKVRVPRKDERTPDQKLLALADSCNGVPDAELRERLAEILASGASVNARGSGTLLFPITLAIRHGSLSMVKALVENGADIKEAKAVGLAVYHGHQGILEYLLARGGDIGEKTARGETLLQVAIRTPNHNPDIIRLLKELGTADQSLPAAAEAGDLDAIRRLVAAGSDVNALSDEGLPPLTLAAQAGQIEACKLLIELGANPARKTRKGSTPLDYLLSTGKADAVPLLVEHSPPEALRTALLTAAGQHKSDLMRQILARLPDPSELLVEDAESRLTSALLLMSDTELQILEQAGLQLPLWAAARFGRLERMKELIAAGADVNEPPANGTRETPLLLAVRNGRYEAAKLLLASKANPDTRSGNMTQPTPLHEAAEKGDVSLVRLLTAHGVALNPLDSLERPPLYYAVAAQNREVSAVLLKAGADPNIQVHSGEHDPAGNRLKVPLWKLAKDPDLVRLLKSKGAR